MWLFNEGINMNPPLLVLDSHYLCHRAFHSQSDLSWNGILTGVIFGFLKSIGQLKNEFETDRVAFCFEGDTLYRKVFFPEYKQRRIQYEKEKDPEKLKARGDLYRQIDALRTQYLRRIGFKNIFYSPGWESDDLMARIAQRTEGEVILVTSDADMYQCLSDNVSMWSPQKKQMFTRDWFIKEYGIEPKRWAVVKALAGCGTDGVPGIPGVGEITAIKFLRGELKRTSSAYTAIKSPEGCAIVNRNRKLVELPCEDPPTPDPEWQEDAVSERGWNEVCEKLGMRSLAGRPPVFNRRMLRE